MSKGVVKIKTADAGNILQPCSLTHTLTHTYTGCSLLQELRIPNYKCQAKFLMITLSALHGDRHVQEGVIYPSLYYNEQVCPLKQLLSLLSGFKNFNVILV